MQPPDAEGFTRFPAITCPYCGKKLDAAGLPGWMDPVNPVDGDMSLCFDCAQPSVFVITAFGVGMRRLTPEERAEFFAEFGDDVTDLIAFNIAFPRPLNRPGADDG